MHKDFDTWSNQKKKIHKDHVRPHVAEREIWFCALGVNVGFEQDGAGESHLRPVLVLKKFNNEIFWGIPLTRTQRNSPYYYTFTFHDGTRSSAILSQLRLIDSKRLQYKSSVMSQDNFVALTKKLKDLFP